MNLYFTWLRQCSPLPCALSGRTDSVDLAHTGGWKEGKAGARKAADWTVLPLHRSLHRAEEAGRRNFWARALPGADPVDFARRLYDQYEKRDRAAAESILAEIHFDFANLTFLATILRRAA